jgi:hypothetical protein
MDKILGECKLPKQIKEKLKNLNNLYPLKFDFVINNICVRNPYVQMAS